MYELTLLWVAASVLGAFTMSLAARVPLASIIGFGVGGGAFYLLFGLLATLEPWAISQIRLHAFLACTAAAACIFFFSAKLFPKTSLNSIVNSNAQTQQGMMALHNSYGSTFLGLYVLILVVLGGYLTVMTPAHAWDFLDAWGPLAEARATCMSQETLVVACWPPEWWQRHPATLGAIISIGFVDDYVTSSVSTVGIVWLHLAASCLFIIAGFLIVFTQSLALALLGCASWLTIPLIGNHLQLIGYAEIWVLFCLMAAIAIFSMYCKTRHIIFCFVGAALIAMPVLLKNIGGVYVIAVLAAVTLTGLFSAYPGALVKLLLALTAAMGILYVATTSSEILIMDLYEDDLNGLPQNVAVVNGFSLEFGGRILRFIAPTKYQILHVEYFSKIVNSSFTICFLFLFLSILAATSNIISGRHYLENSIFLFISLSSCFILLALFLSLFFDLGFRHALPNFDTGHSRFSLLAFGLSPMLLISHGLWRFDLGRQSGKRI